MYALIIFTIGLLRVQVGGNNELMDHCFVKRLSFCLLLALLGQQGCNLTYKVRNQFHEIEEIVYLPCGKISVELVGKGNSKFTFKQRLELDKPIQLKLDALTVLYNNQRISIQHNLRNNRQSGQMVKIKAKEVWEASFQFDSGVYEGDTIKVFAHNYVQCEGVSISLDTLKFTFVNAFTIHGVNNP